MNLDNLLELQNYIDITCFESNFNDIERILHEVFINEIKGDIDFSIKGFEIVKLMKTIAVANRNKRIAVIYEPSNRHEGTVFFSNLSDGWYTLVNILNRKDRGIAYRLKLSSLAIKYPQNIFEVFEGGLCKRKIMTLKDGAKWQFFEKGDKLDFEYTKGYTNPKIKNRLTPNTIVEYLKYNGWNLLEDSFWLASRISVFSR